MKLNKQIVSKFNALFIEMSKYYNKSENLRIGANGLYTIYSEDFHYTGKAIHEHSADSIRVNEFLIFLKLEYKYFLPFFRLHFSLIKSSGIDFRYDMFTEINSVIQEIREEKQSSNKRLDMDFLLS